MNGPVPLSCPGGFRRRFRDPHRRRRISAGIQSGLSSLPFAWPQKNPARLRTSVGNPPVAKTFASMESKTAFMARIYPFRALRYNPALVRLDDVVTQPYDQISPAMQQAYYQRNPYNLVRIILGLPELFDAQKGESVYTRAARDFRAWREQGVLIQEKDPCVFAYSQRFVEPGSGSVKERRGFIALGKLYEYGARVVFPHEHPPAGPKTDRLNLLRATRAHFGPIFMLYSDPARTVEKLLFDANGPADGEATDEYGVLNRIWRVNDPAMLRLLITAMEDKKLIIAAGRHCYETALDYSRESAAACAARAGGESRAEFSPAHVPEPDFPEAAAMMTFVNMDSEGLAILPTHRVVQGLAHFDPGSFARAAEEFFTVKKTAAVETIPLLEMLRKTEGTAFVAVTRHGALLLRSKIEAMDAALQNVPMRQRRLDLTQLHAVVLERLLGLDARAMREGPQIRYLREAGEAVEQVRRGEADVSFLTNPVTMDQLREVAFAGDAMPQKSTDFYPRPLSGLAIYALE